MAAKVNKTVVIYLILGVVCVVGGIMFMMTFVLRSGADLARQGDKLMEAGKYEEAAASYSKAVNKNQNNVQFIEKWAASLRKQNPTSLQAYTDRYRNWVQTQRLRANVLRNDPAAFAVVLELVLRDARLSPRPGSAWQSLESDTSDILSRLSREPQETQDKLRRYRGIATVGKMSAALEVSAEDRKRAKEDLAAALKLNPADSLTSAYYADMMRLTATKLRQSNNEDEADLALAEGLAFMQDFCAKNPTSTAARLGLFQLELDDLNNRARKDPSATEQLRTQVRPKLEQLMATLESEDPKNVDELIASRVLEMAASEKLDNAAARGDAIYKKIAASRPDEPFAKLMLARFYITTNEPRKAADAFKAIMDLPNLAVSPEGIALFGVRDTAALQRVEALIALTDRETDTAKRAALLTETKAARDDVRGRASIDEAPKTLIDAKVALLTKDFAEARKLLGQYHQATGYSDAQALMLSATVLMQQGLKGEAKTMLTRIVDKRIAGPFVYAMLARIDLELGNAPSALTWAETGLQLAPNDAGLQQLYTLAKQAVNGVNDADPFTRAYAEASAAFLQTPPDFDTARSKCLTALPLADDADKFLRLAGLLRRSPSTGREDALMAVNRGLEKFPTHAGLIATKKALEVTDSLKAGIEEIENAKDLSPIDKELRRYFLYVQANKPVEAGQALDAAAKLDTDHPVVIAGLFERALAKRDYETAKPLAVKAKEKNLDKVDGRIYQARLDQVQGNAKDAIPLLERATELDAYNPLTWRYLGAAYMMTGDQTKALRAYDRSLQIKPDDITSIVARIQCLMAIDRTADALTAAKEASRLGISDPNFVQLWLMLEFRAGDKDLALERRAFIHSKQPDNFDNALEFAKNLIEARRLEEATRVMADIETAAAKAPEETRKNLEIPMSMIRAALRGARNDTAGALADFEKLAESLPEDRRESAYIEFANIVATFTTPSENSLVVQVLEAGRKYQDARPKNAAGKDAPVARIDRMLGDLHFTAGQWEKARTAYTRAREVTPTDTDKLLLKRIIECWMKQQKFDEARKLIDAEGGDKASDLQILLLASQLELARGDKAKSMEILNRAQEVAPNNYLPYRQRGIQRMEDRKSLDDAITDFEQAIGLEPRNVDLVILLTRACIRKPDLPRAESTLEKGLAIQPDSAALRGEQIQLLMNQNKIDAALTKVDEAIKADPTNTRWHLFKGVIYQRQDKQRDAATAYEQAWAIRKAPDTGKALADARIAEFDKSNSTDKGALDRAQAVIEDPAFAADSEPMSRLSRMSLRQRQHRRSDAIADLRAIVGDKRIQLSNPQVAAILLDELRRAFSGDMTNVIATLDEVKPAEGWPEMFKVFIARAQVSDAKTHAAALTDLAGLTKSSDKSVALAAASTLGGNLYLDAVNAGKKPGGQEQARPMYQQAVEVFQSGLSLDPESSELNNNLAFILAKGLNDPKAALPFGLKAAAKDPNNPNILDTLGTIQFMSGNLVEAEKTLNQALAASTDAPTRTMPLIHMIEVQTAKGDRTAAENLFRELKSIEAADPRVKANYERDIEEIAKRMQPTP